MTSESAITRYVASAFTDLWSGAFPVTLSATTIELGLHNFMQRRENEAKGILLEEISRGMTLSSEVPPDSFFGLLFRYLTATKHGAARLNLRLMAQLVSGALEPRTEFYADEFAQYSDVLSNLKRTEVILVSTMASVREKLLAAGQTTGEENAIKIHNESKTALIGHVFATEDDFEAAAVATTRTGLILSRSVWGGTRYDLSPIADRILHLCSFEAALVAEPN